MKIFPAHYFPPIPWFVAAMPEETVQIEVWQHYRKQRYASRMSILGANGPLNLVIPVTRRGAKVPLLEKKISYAENWQKQHWNSLLSAYRNAPYFEYYEAELEVLLFQRWENLLDLQIAAWEWVWKQLRFSSTRQLTEEYLPSEQYELDLRAQFEPNTPIPEQYQARPYPQVFEGFVPNLSILDLLCNMGPECRGFLIR